MSRSPAVPLTLTGERTLPGIPEENYWFRRHEAAYARIAPLLTGATVLEAGCGEGYGGDLLLAAGAASVIALDYDALTAAHVATTYPRQHAVRGDLQHLPLAHGSVDAVVNLQVIEHLHDQPGFVAECARVLRPGGRLVVSTPNRLTFTPGGGPPVNPFHTRELTAEDLDALLRKDFSEVTLLGIRHGARLQAWEQVRGPLVDTLITTAPDDWEDDLRDLVESVSVDDFEITADDVDASLDLLALAVRR